MLKTLYPIYGLPTTYDGVTYSDTQLTKVMQDKYEDKMPNAPMAGTLTIQGTAAPIVNQLLELGRSVRGIDFTARSEDPWSPHQNPIADIVLLYGVGFEVSMNGKVGGLVIKNLAKFYSNKKTLLVLETDLTKSELLTRYDFKATNFIKILQKEENIWV